MAQCVGYSGPLLSLLPEAFGCPSTIPFLVSVFIRKWKQKGTELKSVWFVNFYFYRAFPKWMVERFILFTGVIQTLYAMNTDS